jgi:hypothetical protein
MPLVCKPNGFYSESWTWDPRKAATNAIASFEAKLFLGREGQLGTIWEDDCWRIDRQKNIGATAEKRPDGRIDKVGSTNLQVQRNGVRNTPSTVATLLVWNQYYFDLPGPGDENRTSEFTRAIRHGLNLSLASWGMVTEAGPWGKRSARVFIYEMSGDFSSRKREFVSPQKPVK